MDPNLTLLKMLLKIAPFIQPCNSFYTILKWIFPVMIFRRAEGIKNTIIRGNHRQIARSASPGWFTDCPVCTNCFGVPWLFHCLRARLKILFLVRGSQLFNLTGRLKLDWCSVDVGIYTYNICKRGVQKIRACCRVVNLGAGIVRYLVILWSYTTWYWV